jgi:hypothetical protein
MSEAKLWKGGLPYGPQVKKLEEAYPRPEEDSVISHEDFVALVSETKGTQRYYGVINSWRKKLFNELGIDTAWLPGDGIKILPPADRLKVSEGDFKTGLRKAKRAVRRLAATPRERLDDIGRKRYDHTAIVMAKVSSVADEARKQLAIDLAPVKSLPRPQLVLKEMAGS